MQGILSWYRQARDLKRVEDEADRTTNLQSMLLLGKVQMELQDRIAKAEHDVIELAQRIESVRCVFPDPDGSPRCKANVLDQESDSKKGRELPPA